jgi:hypothetical protein
MNVPDLRTIISHEEYLTDLALGTHLHNPCDRDFKPLDLGSQEWRDTLEWSKAVWQVYLEEKKREI